MWLILQALEHGQNIAHKNLHLNELGIATLTSCFVNANRAKKGKASNASDFFYFAPREGINAVRLNAYACNSFFSLIKDNKLPKWVMGIAPLKRIRECKDDGFVPSSRALVGVDCLILSYTKYGDKVFSPLSFIGFSHGTTMVVDADTGEQCLVDTSAFGLRSTIVDGEYPING